MAKEKNGMLMDFGSFFSISLTHSFLSYSQLNGKRTRDKKHFTTFLVFSFEGYLSITAAAAAAGCDCWLAN